MTDTPHSFNSIDVHPAEPAGDDHWAGPEARYARFDADDAALRKQWARDSVDEADHNASLARIYRDTAASSAHRSDINADRSSVNADSADLSAGSARLAAETAGLSAEIANTAAQSAISARNLAHTLIMFALGLSLGLMLAILIYLWVVTITRDVAPLAPYHGATPTAPHQLRPAP